MGKTKKSAIIALVVFLVLAAGIAALYFALREAPETGSKSVTITVVAHGETVYLKTLKTDAEYLLNLLVENELVETQDSVYGAFIVGMCSIVADSAAGEWWCITKGGEQHMLGAAETPLADGDAYELTLTVGYDF